MGRITLPAIEDARKNSNLPAEWLEPFRRRIEEEVGKAIFDHRVACTFTLEEMPEAPRMIKKLSQEVTFMGDKKDPQQTGYLLGVNSVTALPNGKHTVVMTIAWGKGYKPEAAPDLEVLRAEVARLRSLDCSNKAASILANTGTTELPPLP